MVIVQIELIQFEFLMPKLLSFMHNLIKFIYISNLLRVLRQIIFKNPFLLEVML